MDYYSHQKNRSDSWRRAISKIGHILMPLCFASAIVFFFFSFCNFSILSNLAEAPQSEITQQSLSGFNFITGIVLPAFPLTNENDHFADNEILLKKITANIWAILALAAAIGGEVISLQKGKDQSGYAIMLAISGFLCLIILSFSVNKYERETAAGLFIVYTAISFQFGYWAALVAFILAAAISYLQLNKKSGLPDSGRQSSPIHISIITRHSDEREEW